MTVSRPSINFRTEQTVISDAEMKPYVGFEHLVETVDGWDYNIKKWNSLFDLRLPVLPSLSDPSSQGISESEYFLSGVGDKESGDLFLSSIREQFLLTTKNTSNTISGLIEEDYNREKQWIPVLKNGWYFRYQTPFFLYSDRSRIQYVDSANNRDGRNYLELSTEPGLNSPVLAASFKRNPVNKTPGYSIKPNCVSQFSGIYIDHVEQETVTETGSIIWDNVDFTKREFIIDNSIEGKTVLFFNRDFTKTIGVIPTVFQDLAACEILGSASGIAFQVYRLENFPVVIDSSFHLYVADSSTWEEWTRVDSWFALTSTVASKKYFVDKDLGIVYFGTARYGGAPSIGQQIVVCYKTTLRIEYEEESKDLSISAFNADVNPITQHINQGFVAITHNKLEAASIVLDIDKEKIPFFSNPTEYGPIIVGTDYGILRASVRSIDDIAVQDVLVDFKVAPSGVGTLDGATTSSSITNGSGQAYSSYQPPLTADTLGFYSTTVRTSTHPDYLSGYKEIIVKEMNAGLANQEDNLYVYQVLKDDILLGYSGIDEWIEEQIEEETLAVPSYVGEDPVLVSVAGDNPSGGCQVSTDKGLTWTGYSMPDNSLGYKHVTYGAGILIAVSDSGAGSNKIARSTDTGKTWSLVTLPSSHTWYDVAYGDGVWIIVGSNNYDILRSTDAGLTWSTVTVPNNRTWTRVIYADGIFMAVGYNYGKESIMRSLDNGVTWVTVELSDAQSYHSLAYGDGNFVMLDVANKAAVSTDKGLTWTLYTLPANQQWTDLTYGNGRFVGCGGTGGDQFIYSTDGGLTWAVVNPPDTSEPRGICWVSGDIFIATCRQATSGRVKRSTDGGVTWDDIASASLLKWYGVCSTYEPGPVSKQEWKDELAIKYDLKEWAGVQADGSMDGRKVVVYKIDPTGASAHDGDNWDTQAIDPVGNQTTDPVEPQLGAVVPLRPELIAKITDDSDTYYGFYRVIYPAAAILDPDPDDDDNNLGGYWLVSSRTIALRAFCWSGLYNRTIQSNEIVVRLSLPSYMQGESLTDLAKKVPYGWKLLESDSNDAAALDGATFITINPHGSYDASSPYNQILWGPYRLFDVINGTIDEKEEWVSAPFQSVGFQWKK